MAVGIEITSRAVRAVRLAGRRPRRDDRAIEVPLPSPGGPLPVDELRRAMNELGVRDGKVGVAIPSTWCCFRSVSFPYRQTARVERTVAYSLEGRLPGPVEDFIIEPVGPLVRAGETGARLLVVACPKARIKALLDELRPAGIDPILVQPAPLSAVAACDAGPGEALLLRLDERCEGLILTPSGPVAGMAADLDGVDPVADSGLAADRIARAVTTYELADGSATFSRVLLSAPETCAEALAGDVESRLGRKTVRVSSPETPWLAAAGIAMQCAGAAHLAPTFRRDQFTYPPHARRREAKLAAAVLLAIGILGLVAAAGIRAGIRANDDIASLRERRRQAFVEVTGLTKSPPILAQMEAALKSARDDSRRGQSGRSVSALLRWADFMRLAPDRASVRFDSIDISPRRLIFTARVQDTATAERLKAAVESSPRFTSSSYSLSVKTENNATYYVLDMELGYKR